MKLPRIKMTYENPVPASERPKIERSSDAYEILVREWDRINFIESFNILLLNRSNRVLGMAEISKGVTAGTIADPKLIFSAALLAGASSIILAHNHPSGNKRPSAADEVMTKKIREAGKYIEIEVIDHIILSPEDTYYSFADEGMMI